MLVGIKANPNNILQVEKLIIFSLVTLVIFFTILFIIKIKKLKEEKNETIYKNMKIASTLCKKFPSSICLASKSSEFIGSFPVGALNRVSIEIVVSNKSMKDTI